MHKLVVLATALFFPAVVAAEAQTAFDRLKSLVGHWEGRTTKGRVLAVDYRLTANGSVLVETWTLSPTRESMTVYHRDGERLLATHYCPIGNQPRLALEPSAGTDTLAFDVESVTNLVDPKTSHQQRFAITFRGADAFDRDETYIEDGKASSEPVSFTRVGAKSE